MEFDYWIKTKPSYTALAWVEQASAHIVIAEQAGGLSAIRMFQQRPPIKPVTLLYVEPSQGEINYAANLQKVAPANSLHTFQSTQQAIDQLADILPTFHMGTRLYIAGGEHFIWQVAKTASQAGISKHEMAMEQTGTLARPVYCVHCKTITPAAHTNIAKCDGCHKMLFVRDHFSQHLGAYMGFMADAENPGDLPEIEEIYP